MAKKKHEEHTNHEAWAIPYADMITLLLAFFVVMYSISAVNEGKYRVLSDALSQAFGGPPKSIKPVQIGSKKQSGSDSDQKLNIFEKSTGDQSIGGTMRDLRNPAVIPSKIKTMIPAPQTNPAGNSGYAGHAELQRMADAVAKAMGELIQRNMVIVRRTETRLEVEIRTDILFASGSAQIADNAQAVLAKLAGILKPFPNGLRIEGHTDNKPIHTAAFASNWELSSARAAGVVHLFMEQGVDPQRMAVEGFGEYRPAADNATADGRNHNRRVVIVVLADTNQPLPPNVNAAAPATPPAAAAGGGANAAPAAAASAVPTPAPAAADDKTAAAAPNGADGKAAAPPPAAAPPG